MSNTVMFSPLHWKVDPTIEKELDIQPNSTT